MSIYFVKHRNKRVNQNLKISTEHNGLYHCGGLQEFHVTHVSRRSLKIAKSDFSFFMFACVSIRPSAWNNSAPIKRILMKFDI